MPNDRIVAQHRSGWLGHVTHSPRHTNPPTRPPPTRLRLSKGVAQSDDPAQHRKNQAPVAIGIDARWSRISQRGMEPPAPWFTRPHPKGPPLSCSHRKGISRHSRRNPAHRGHDRSRCMVQPGPLCRYGPAGNSSRFVDGPCGRFKNTAKEGALTGPRFLAHWFCFSCSPVSSRVSRQRHALWSRFRLQSGAVRDYTWFMKPTACLL